MLELICVIIINALINVIFEDNWKPFIVLVILYLFCSFMGLLSQQTTYCHLQIILQIAVGYLFILNRLSACFYNQYSVNLLLNCFLCIFVEMITDDRDCPTHRYALLEYKAVRIYPQCIRYHPQNGIPVLLPASYISSRRIAFDD